VSASSFGAHAGGFGRCADPLQDRECVPQSGLGFGLAAGGQGAQAQACQGVSLLRATADLTGQLQGMPVTYAGPAEVIASSA
jgi:hypothetical protein